MHHIWHCKWPRDSNISKKGQKNQLWQKNKKNMEMLKLLHPCHNFLCICPNISLEENNTQTPHPRNKLIKANCWRPLPLKDMGRCAHHHSPPKLPVREAGRAGGEGAGIVNLNATQERKFLSIKTDVHSKPDSSSTDGYFPMKSRNFSNFLL